MELKGLRETAFVDLCSKDPRVLAAAEKQAVKAARAKWLKRPSWQSNRHSRPVEPAHAPPRSMLGENHRKSRGSWRFNNIFYPEDEEWSEVPEQNEPVDEPPGDHGRAPSPARVPRRGTTFRYKATASGRHGATQAAWDTVSSSYASKK